MTYRRALVLLLLILANLALAEEPAGRDSASPVAAATQIIAASGFPGGVAVELGATDSRLISALAQGGRFLVQGLAADGKAVVACRQELMAAGKYGRVTVDRAEAADLPYIDNLVNILVVDDFPGATARGLPLAEIVRVLCPQGAAFLGPNTLTVDTVEQAMTSAGTAGAEVSKIGPWVRIRNPRPKEIDDWTHYRHGPDQNMVSRDMVSKNLDRLQWLAQPTIARMTHNAVTADGRIYYWVPRRGVQDEKPPCYVLMARDAFNGTLLWEREIRGEMPQIMPMVAADGNLYAATGLATTRAAEPNYNQNVFLAAGPIGPLQCLDGSTGQVRGTFKGITPVQLALADGVMVIADQAGSKAAFDVRTFEKKWETTLGGPPIVSGGQVFVGNVTKLAALDLKTGRELWSKETGVTTNRPDEPLQCFYQGVLLALDSGTVRAFSAKDGSHLWDYACRPRSRSVYGVKDLVWVYVQEKADDKERWAAVGLDPQSGREARRADLPEQYPDAHKIHQNCYPMRATERFLILNEQKPAERQNDLLDWTDKSVTTVIPFKRGGCSFGLLPANGMIYLTPFQCNCGDSRRHLIGFAAFAPGGGANAQADQQGVLEKGPAYDLKLSPAAATGPDDWPSHMHDAGRTNATPVERPAGLKLLWEAPASGSLAGLSSSSGMVVAVAREQCTVRALDAGSGRQLWSFTAGACIDSSPTLSRGRCVFGSNDGWVYCLRLKDGQLAWRYRAADRERRMVAFDRIESSTPVPGSVVVQDGAVIFSVGRADRLEGGLRVCAVALATGRPFWQTPANGARGPNDLLVSDGKSVRLQAKSFDIRTGETRPGSVSDRSQLLYNDYTWWGRSKFAVPISADRLAFDSRRCYGVKWVTADNPALRIQLKHKRVESSLLVAGTAQTKLDWQTPLPFLGNSICLAKDKLLVAGTMYSPEAVDKPEASPPQSVLWVVAAEDGRKVKDVPLQGKPADDGVIVSEGRIFIALADGRIVCFAGK